MEFYIFKKGHERNARKLLVESGVKTAEEVAYMLCDEVIKEINKHFVVLGSGEDFQFQVVSKKDFKNVEPYIKSINK